MDKDRKTDLKCPHLTIWGGCGFPGSATFKEKTPIKDQPFSCSVVNKSLERQKRCSGYNTPKVVGDLEKTSRQSWY